MINRKTWSVLVILALISISIWLKFTYPQFTFINLSIDRTKAVEIAKEYLTKEKNVDCSKYISAVVFSGNHNADRYLQHAIGFTGEMSFLKRYNYGLFFWKIRFFQQGEKEQYVVLVSAATGEVEKYNHTIEDSAARPSQTLEEAREKAVNFLKTKFNFIPEEYVPSAERTSKFDNRTEYAFSWERKDVFIKWSPEEDSGGAKYIIGASVSGDEILSFFKNNLRIPDQFNRDIKRKMTVGSNLAVLFRIIFFLLLASSIFYVVVRRNDLVMHTTKIFCITITVILFLLHLLSYINEFQNILFRYTSTSTFLSYFWRYVTGAIMGAFLVTITILMPCLSGESLRFEVFPGKKAGSFLHYIISTVWSRNVFYLILLGYVVSIIMVGLQSIIFALGQGHMGVWIEYTWMAQLSSSYLPFLTAFIIGVNASFSEEITFRLFAINFGKKFIKNLFAAVMISSILWGYGHSSYPVFPMWFRGLEVTILGLFLSVIYLRFGIIPVLVAHYVFDVFWGCSAYLLGRSTPYYFYSSLVILLIPFFLAVVAYIKNKPEEERPLRWRLTNHQKYNLKILKHYLTDQHLLINKTKDELDKLKKEIHSHGWDISVVEIAFEDLLEGR